MKDSVLILIKTDGTRVTKTGGKEGFPPLTSTQNYSGDRWTFLTRTKLNFYAASLMYANINQIINIFTSVLSFENIYIFERIEYKSINGNIERKKPIFYSKA